MLTLVFLEHAWRHWVSHGPQETQMVPHIQLGCRKTRVP